MAPLWPRVPDKYDDALWDAKVAATGDRVFRRYGVNRSGFAGGCFVWVMPPAAGFPAPPSLLFRALQCSARLSA